MSRRQRRVTPPIGFSYADANKDRIISFADDVLGIKKQIEETWPELYVVFDSVDEVFCIIEKCRDGSESLVCTTDQLDGRIIKRLELADTTKAGQSHEDILDKIDAENDKKEEDDFRVFAEITGDAGERLIHAFKKDGLHDHENIFGPKPKPHLSNRAATKGRPVEEFL